MKVTPMAVPAPTQPAPASQAYAAEARERAIAKLVPQVQETAVLNPNQVQPEEMTAIRAPRSLEPEIPPPDEILLDEEVKSPTPKEDPKLANQYAQLAKRERQIRAQQVKLQQEYQAKEQELSTRVQQAVDAALAAKEQEYQSKYIPRSRLKEDFIGVAQENNLTYDEITQQYLNLPNRDPRVDSIINELRNDIKSLKQTTETSSKQQQDRETQQYQAAVNQIKADVKHLVTNDPEFETIKATNSISDVVELIERTYQKDGIILSVQEAAKEVEDYLVEEAYGLTKIQKIQKRLQENASKSQTTTPAQIQEAVKQPQPSKTLTNSMGAARQMSARDRAIAAMEGKLK